MVIRMSHGDSGRIIAVPDDASLFFFQSSAPFRGALLQMASGLAGRLRTDIPLGATLSLASGDRQYIAERFGLDRLSAAAVHPYNAYRVRMRNGLVAELDLGERYLEVSGQRYHRVPTTMRVGDYDGFEGKGGSVALCVTQVILPPAEHVEPLTVEDRAVLYAGGMP